MKYKRILILLFCGSTSILNAQNMYKHNFTTYTGIANHKVKDETISPMIYRGTVMPIGIELNFKYKHYIHRLLTSFDKLELKSNISNSDQNNTHTLNNINYRFEYSIKRNIISNEQCNHYFGFKLSSFINYRDLEINKNWTGTTRTVDHASSLSIAYTFTYDNIPIVFDKLDFHISTPFASYILLEGTYNAIVNEDFYYLDINDNVIGQIYKGGSFVTFDKFFQIASNILFTKQLNSRFSTKLSYQFNFYSFNKYENLLKVKSLNNLLLFGITFNFTKNEK
jgi:hypothetical protein